VHLLGAVEHLVHHARILVVELGGVQHEKVVCLLQSLDELLLSRLVNDEHGEALQPQRMFRLGDVLHDSTESIGALKERVVDEHGLDAVVRSRWSARRDTGAGLAR